MTSPTPSFARWVAAAAACALCTAAAPAMAAAVARAEIRDLTFLQSPMSPRMVFDGVPAPAGVTSYSLDLNGQLFLKDADSLLPSDSLARTVGTARGTGSSGLRAMASEASAGNRGAAAAGTLINLTQPLSVGPRSVLRVTFDWVLSVRVDQDDPFCSFGAGCESAIANLLMVTSDGDVSGLPTDPLAAYGDEGERSIVLHGTGLWEVSNYKVLSSLDVFFSLTTSAVAYGISNPPGVDPNPDPTPVPAPGTAALMAAALLSAGVLRRRRVAAPAA